VCGIAGLVNLDAPRPTLTARLRAMCGAMLHRGPDEGGEYIDGPVAIGMRRLSIIDVASGRQPIANEDSTIWVVQNGEIYNYRMLTRELEAKGHKFRTTSDTEVIVHLYEDWGPECVRFLRGMFAFAIWDSRQRTLILARDRVGIKPMYYAQVGPGLLFASELKALLTQPEVRRTLCPEALTEYFRHLCVPGDLAIFEGVRKLPPGHILTIRDGVVRLVRYWRLGPDPDETTTEDEWLEQLRERLRDAIESHLAADVPVGAFLSGGLDSGALVALMARASTDPVRTFTIGFVTPTGRFDERDAARKVAKQYETAHEECLLEADVGAIFPRIVRAFDEPFADSSAVPNWLVCEQTARHVKVALSGLGADEAFGGYERYVGLTVGETYRRIPSVLRRLIARAVNCLPEDSGTSYVRERLKRFVRVGDLPARERYCAMISAFAGAEEILHPDVAALVKDTARRYDAVMDELDARHVLDLALFNDLAMYLPDDLLTLTDRISMAHSLEVRVPYLDHELLEFVARMPATLKVRGFRKKWLFRRAVAPWLPVSHLRRPKQGFSIPLASWLRGPLASMLSDLVDSRACRESPWLNRVAVERLVDEHLTGRANHEIRLWAILCFLEWERQYMKPHVASSAALIG
jgi:asparagine synthase (glutamine-hydrolysing)